MDPTIVTQVIVSGLLTGFIFALIAIGLSLIFGMMEVVNFAHGEFLMISMYASFWMFSLWRIDPLLSLPICAALLAVIGIATYKLIVRRALRGPPVAQLISTFGLGVTLQSVAQFLWTPDYRMIRNPILSGRIQIGGLFIPIAQLAAALISIAACALVFWLMTRTELGRAMQATAEDRDAAALVGIDSEHMFTLAWAISAACVGVAGAALSNLFYIYPSVGAVFSLTAYVIVALGGFGSIEGAVVGGLIIGLVQTLGGLLIDPVLKMVVVYSVYFLVLMLRPQGLFGRF